MKNVLFITTTPNQGGNGDTLIETAMTMAKDCNVQRVDVRDLQIGLCKACYGCAQTGVCVQQDNFAGLLQKIHEADAIIAEAPIYYNCMAAQAIVVINRLCCTFACKNYQIGPQKRVAVMLTCTGSEPAEMKRHVRNILTLPSLKRAISDYRTEVFTDCVSDNTCRERTDYQKLAKEIALWAIG